MLTAIDCCAGAGGLSLGLQRAGWDVLGVELDPDAVATHRAQVGPCDEADVTAWHPASSADLVVGGVPCETFSTAGKRAGMDDPKGSLFAHLLRVAVEANARVVMLENVRGMVSMGMVPVLEAAFRAHGYEPRHALLNAVDYGTPQNRVRLIVVGFRFAEDLSTWCWPEPSHGPPGNVLGLPRWRTVRDALGLVGEFRMGRTETAIAGGWFNGGRYIDADAPVPTQTRKNNGELLSPLDRPSPTVMTNNNRTPFGDVEVRARMLAACRAEGVERINVAGKAALQGFPPGFEFAGTIHSQHEQSGRAVPPQLGEALGRAAARALARCAP